MRKAMALILCALLLTLCAHAEPAMTPYTLGPVAYVVPADWTAEDGGESVRYHYRSAGDPLAGCLSVTLADAKAYGELTAGTDLLKAVAKVMTDEFTGEEDGADAALREDTAAGCPAVRFTCRYHRDNAVACLLFVRDGNLCAFLYMERGLTEREADARLTEIAAAIGAAE